MEEPRSQIRAMSGTLLGAAGVHNRRVVIDALRTNGALSRAALARATRLAKQTLSNIIEDLERDGLVVAHEAVRDGRGKPAVPYGLAPDGAFAIGLQIDRHLARTVVVNLPGEVVLRHESRLRTGDPEAGLDELAALVRETCSTLAARHPDAAGRILGLGVAMPGPFGPRPDARADDAYSMARWQAFPLTARLEEATGLAVSLQNDSTAAATAERLMGRAHGLGSAVCIYLGYGLGAGVIVNGELYAGQDGNAGEIGMAHSPFDDPAGGSLEHSVSLAAFCQAFSLDPAAPDLMAQIEARIEAGGAEFERWTGAAAARLDWVTDLMQLLLAPQTIILCGTAPAALIARLAHEVTRRRQGAGKSALLAGLTDPWIVAIGAAAEPISRAFDPRYSALLKP